MRLLHFDRVHLPRRGMLLGAIALSLGFSSPQPLPSQAAAPAAQKDAGSPKSATPKSNEVIIHYHRFDGDYNDVGLWTWDGREQKSPTNQEVMAAGRDEFGAYFILNLDQYGNDNSASERIGIIPRLGRSWDRKDGGDRFWTPALGQRVYMVAQDDKIYTTRPDISPKMKTAYLDSPKRIIVSPSHPVDPSVLAARHWKLTSTNGIVPVIESVAAMQSNPAGRATLLAVNLQTPPDWAKSRFTLTVEGYRPVIVQPRKVLDELPAPTGPLGATYTKEKTTFRVFAPLAESLSVVLYDESRGTAGRKLVEARREASGAWATEVVGDLAGKHYRYLIKNLGREAIEVNDPEARNTTGPDGHARITDLRATDPEGFRPMKRPYAGKSPVDAIITELHVRDFTIAKDSGVADGKRGKYLGFVETGTTLPGKPGVKTGIDHLKELGVTHVHLLPVADFDNSSETDKDAYNWGYMTAFFNSPDGWYASKVEGDARVREFKQLVKGLHDAGIAVVMDVVYNHAGEQNTLERVAPGYFLRLRDDGTFWNGSGCGNEFRSESPLGRRFIVDSVKYWHEEYGIDGFRFDLMGLIDIETMKQVKSELEAQYPGILVYGEPWAAAGQDGVGISRITYKDVVRGTGIGAFNDNFRNAVKGSPDGDDAGYVVSGANRDAVIKGIAGSIDDWSASPVESINYGDKHDNLCLLDKLSKSARGASIDDLARMTMLNGAILTVSQGIPFFHGGVEILRSKQGNSNSYNAPDSINQITWSNKATYRNVFDYYKGLFALRKAHPLFRLRTADDIRKRVHFHHVALPAPSCIVFSVDGVGLQGETWKKAVVLINPTTSDQKFVLPDGITAARVFALGDKASTEALAAVSTPVTVPARSAAILAVE